MKRTAFGSPPREGVAPSEDFMSLYSYPDPSPNQLVPFRREIGCGPTRRPREVREPSDGQPRARGPTWEHQSYPAMSSKECLPSEISDEIHHVPHLLGALFSCSEWGTGPSSLTGVRTARLVLTFHCASMQRMHCKRTSYPSIRPEGVIR